MEEDILSLVIIGFGNVTFEIFYKCFPFGDHVRGFMDIYKILYILMDSNSLLLIKISAI